MKFGAVLGRVIKLAMSVLLRARLQPCRSSEEKKGALAPEVRLLLPHFDSLYLSHGLPSAAKAAFLATAFGTAEAVPLTDTGARVKVEIL